MADLDFGPFANLRIEADSDFEKLKNFPDRSTFGFLELVKGPDWSRCEF